MRPGSRIMQASGKWSTNRSMSFQMLRKLPAQKPALASRFATPQTGHHPQLRLIPCRVPQYPCSSRQGLSATCTGTACGGRTHVGAQHLELVLGGVLHRNVDGRLVRSHGLLRHLLGRQECKLLQGGLHAGLNLPPPQHPGEAACRQQSWLARINSRGRPIHAVFDSLNHSWLLLLATSEVQLAGLQLSRWASRSTGCGAPVPTKDSLTQIERRGSHLRARLVEVAVPVHTVPNTFCQHARQEP